MGVGLRRGWACGPDFRAVWWFPPVLGGAAQAALKGAVQELPGALGIGMANWNWRVVHQFVAEQFGISLSRAVA